MWFLSEIAYYMWQGFFTCDDHSHVSPISGQPLKDRSKSAWRLHGLHWRMQRGLSVQFLLFSCSFRQNSCQIIGFYPHLWDWCNPPPLGNPGSTTGLDWGFFPWYFLCRLACSVSNQVAKLPVVQLQILTKGPTWSKNMYTLVALDAYSSQLKSSISGGST